MGLAISRYFCQMMGGEITVKSQLGMFQLYGASAIEEGFGSRESRVRCSC